MRKLCKGENYSREETIRGNTVYSTEINRKTLCYAKCKDDAQEGEPKRKILNCIILGFI